MQLRYPPHKALAMIAGCKTRWSSQYMQFTRISGAEMALRSWRLDTRILQQINAPKASDRLMKTAEVLVQPGFFESNAEIIKIIGPICEEITMAEGDDCHIGLVIPRWRRIWDHLRVASVWSTVYRHSPRGLMCKLNDRYQRQITPLHVLAFWLLPRTILDHNSFSQQSNEQTTVLSVLRRYTTDQEFPAIRAAFLNYYTRQESFTADTDAWECADSPKLFLQLHWDDAPGLAVIAIRLLNTIANEVPCERAFSTLKATKSKTRSRLTDDHVDKLCYIQINSRVFARKANLKIVNFDESSDDEGLDIYQDDDSEVPQTSGQSMDSPISLIEALP
jgi:hypothetical protein